MNRSSHLRSLFGSILVLGVLLVFSGCQSESTQDQQSSEPALPDGELSIENPWVEPAPAGSTAALYMTFANGRQSADTLLRVRAPIVDSSAAYRGTEARGTLALPARARTTLNPGSTHVRLNNIDQPLTEGSTPILNLEFAQSDLQRVRVPVRTSPPNQQ